MKSKCCHFRRTLCNRDEILSCKLNHQKFSRRDSWFETDNDDDDGLGSARCLTVIVDDTVQVLMTKKENVL